MTELDPDALEAAAKAAMGHFSFGERGETQAEIWTAIARAAITTYKDATKPIAVICPSCNTLLRWPWKEDPPAETQCSCGAMVPTGWPS